MYGLGLHGVAEHDLGAVALRFRLLQHGRIHRSVFVGLSLNRRLKILAGRGDSGERFQVPLGMDALRLGGGSKQAGDIGPPILLRLLRESAVLLVRLAFSSERLFQIISGIRHDISGLFWTWWCRQDLDFGGVIRVARHHHGGLYVVADVELLILGSRSEEHTSELQSLT